MNQFQINRINFIKEKIRKEFKDITLNKKNQQQLFKLVEELKETKSEQLSSILNRLGFVIVQSSTVDEFGWNMKIVKEKRCK